MPGSHKPDIADEEAVCPRCGQSMQHGFINAGKGPMTWVLRPRQNKTIFAGDRLVRQHWFWGRHLVPAARCESCRYGVFTYPGPGTFGPSR